MIYLPDTVWHSRGVCPSCGWHTYAPFATIFHIPYENCPDCGTRKSDDWNTGWEIRTMRLEYDYSNRRWYKPWTWFGKSYWRTLE